ncbi:MULTISPECIES: FAD-dependent monooxygenase [Devosia]|uniref:2-octaprenyl-3-methyl-6-methoxy-1,4-benzoquinol hydroxylase n=1 Tax=Devosia equisanguinis TaxID=2490941 RepID=A0A447IFV7_9HYPH|nr:MULTISPECIES: FAD-dependent monooxygenase [Devosia]ODT50306.1 MAG: hypothetical protein ABS74_05170 [Pelagibacterium sp. SCN 63-126]ODU83508.1 MAG: hypothetical protein ABT14_15685 [Pelagibacterium sp. SCN 63-17]OJX45050.1 MAG: hypothetical protein BGO80_04170 [Devosia sp. 63-57]VDS06363.1 2-octaprenyl-3-methyl-6-methoxy-1,4-benzoquinol hydroxylase [Devosia equisanguinis]
MDEQSDVIVVGGGLAGIAAAVCLARAGLETLHLAPPSPPDRRTSALMMPSVDFLVAQGLISAPEDIGHALTAIRIIDATGRLIRAPETLFDSTEIGMNAFGWNFANTVLLEQFQKAAPTTGLTTVDGVVNTLRREDGLGVVTLSSGATYRAKLVVGADGKKSLIRAASAIGTHEHQFEEAALVCDLELSRPIGGTSVEFHYPHGPFTLVPAGGRKANLVWIDEEPVLRRVQAGGPEALIQALHQKSQRLFGNISLLSPSVVFPLSSLSVDVAGKDGVALVGEAAHAFPPIGAQGLNLGLRDVSDLVDAVTRSDRRQPDWAREASQTYAELRADDLARTGGFVDTLFRSLLTEMIPSQTARASGLWALKLLPPLRRKAFALGMGERKLL